MKKRQKTNKKNPESHLNQAPTYSLIGSLLNIAYSGVNYAINNPLQALTTLLYFQVQVASALGQKTKFASPYGYDDEHEHVYEHTAKEDLLAKYDIVMNTPTIEDAQYYFLGETHDNMEHHQDKKTFVSLYASKGDFVLMEGVPNDKQFNCNELCVTKDETLSFHRDEALKKYGQSTPPRCEVVYDFEQDLNCGGWEDKESHRLGGQAVVEADALAKKVHSLQEEESRITKSLLDSRSGLNHDSDIKKIKTNLNDFYKQISNAYEIISELNSNATKPDLSLLRKAIDKAIKTNEANDKEKLKEQIVKNLTFVRNELDKSIIKSNTKIHQTEDALVSIRNRKGIVKTLNNYKDANQKFFVFAGKRHLVSKEGSTKLGVNDPRKDLFDYLENKPHAILIPKNKK